MEETIIKNDKQVFFNQVKGRIFEINTEDKFSNVVVSLGHENFRFASFVTKTYLFDAYKDLFSIGDKVVIRFYLSSRKKNDRWYTTATILDINKSE